MLGHFNALWFGFVFWKVSYHPLNRQPPTPESLVHWRNLRQIAQIPRTATSLLISKETFDLCGHLIQIAEPEEHLFCGQNDHKKKKKRRKENKFQLWESNINFMAPAR